MPLVRPAAVQLNCAVWTVTPSPLPLPPELASSLVHPARAAVTRAVSATAEARGRRVVRCMRVLLPWRTSDPTGHGGRERATRRRPQWGPAPRRAVRRWRAGAGVRRERARPERRRAA